MEEIISRKIQFYGDVGFSRRCRIVGLTLADMRVCATKEEFLARLTIRYHQTIQTCHPDRYPTYIAKLRFAKVVRAHDWLEIRGWRHIRGLRTESIPELPWPWAKGWNIAG